MGKDLYKKIQFANDDLVALDYDVTILQAANILSGMRRGDNPGNPNAGLQTNVIAGSNKAIMNFPVIVRQMSQTFAGDDTLKNFSVNNIAVQDDNLAMTYTVFTRLGEVIQNGSFQ